MHGIFSRASFPGVVEVGRVIFSSGGISGKSLVFIEEGGGLKGE
jgi:hypothetical protein